MFIQKITLILLTLVLLLPADDIETKEIFVSKKKYIVQQEVKDSNIENIENTLLKLKNRILTEKRFVLNPNKSLINKLKIKIVANRKNNYKIAENRDIIKLKLLTNDYMFKESINKLITARKNILNKEEYTKILQKTLASISDSDLKVIPNSTSKVTNEYNTNLINLKKDVKEIKYKLLYLIDNVGYIEKKDPIIDFNINSSIRYINNLYPFNLINIYSKHLFNIDMGHLIFSILFMSIIALLKYILLPLLISISKKYLPQDNEKISDINNILNETFSLPLNILFFIISIHIFISFLIPNISELIPFLNFKVIYITMFIWILNRLLNSVIEIYSIDILNKYPQVRKEVILFFKRIFAVVSLIILISVILTSSGINISAIVGGVGFMTLGASLAFKDTFSNFLGSVNVIFDKSFAVGDWIKINDTEGNVIEVGMRKTRIRGFDNSEYTIPNSIMANSTVTNWSKRKIGRRIKMKIGLTYNSSETNLKKLLIDIKDMLENHEGIANRNSSLVGHKKSSNLLRKEDDFGVKKTLLVYLDSFNDSSIDILIYAFSKSILWEDWLATKEDILFNIMGLVSKNDLEFAFPTQTIELKV